MEIIGSFMIVLGIIAFIIFLIWVHFENNRIIGLGIDGTHISYAKLKEFEIKEKYQGIPEWEMTEIIEYEAFWNCCQNCPSSS